MLSFSLLTALAVGLGLAGLVLVALGLYGELPGARRGAKVRASGALTTSRKRLAHLGSGALVSILAWVLSGWPVAAVTVMALWILIPYFFGSGRITARRVSRLEGLDEWTRRLAEVIAAGMAPVPAIVDSADRAPESIRLEVTRLATKLATPRLDRARALREFADEVDDNVSDLISLALKIAVGQQSSERIPDVLRTMAEGVTEEIKARREIEAKRTGPRAEARLMVILVVVMVIGFSLATDYTAPYATFLGQLVMAACAAMVVISLLLLRWLSLGTPTPRILPPVGRS